MCTHPHTHPHQRLEEERGWGNRLLRQEAEEEVEVEVEVEEEEEKEEEEDDKAARQQREQVLAHTHPLSQVPSLLALRVQK